MKLKKKKKISNRNFNTSNRKNIFRISILVLLIFFLFCVSLNFLEKKFNISWRQFFIGFDKKVLADTTTTTITVSCVGSSGGICATITPGTRTTVTTDQGTTTTTSQGNNAIATASSSITSDPLATPMVPLSTVIPTIDPNIVYPTTISTTTNSTITPSGGSGFLMNLFMQLINFFLNIINALLGTSMSFPASSNSILPVATTPGSTVAPTTIASLTIVPSVSSSVTILTPTITVAGVTLNQTSTPTLTPTPTPILYQSPTPILNQTSTPTLTPTSTPILYQSPTPILYQSSTPILYQSPTPTFISGTALTESPATQTIVQDQDLLNVQKEVLQDPDLVAALQDINSFGQALVYGASSIGHFFESIFSHVGKGISSLFILGK